MGDSSDSYVPPPLPPGAVSYGQKKKKKDRARLITSYWLPRLDEMALLKPISTRADGASKEEKTRVETINNRLVDYNRWLTFVPNNAPGKQVREAASGVQDSVHELNSLISRLMIQVDQKIADLQDKTELFIEAVQDGGSWQANGDLLDLHYDELDSILSKHPQRSTAEYGRRIFETIERASPPSDDLYGLDAPPTRYFDKVLRLVQEVEQCPNGVRDAFRLLAIVKSELVPRLQSRSAYVPLRDSQRQFERIDELLVDLVKKRNAALYGRRKEYECEYFDFAATRRLLYDGLPRRCRYCNRPPTPDGDPFPTYFPYPPCLRAPHYKLLEKVQKWSWGEIRFGAMLLSKRLPKEVCWLIFEFAIEAEDVPLDPRVWNEDEYLVGMTIFGTVKSEYQCPSRAGRRRRDSISDFGSIDI